MVKDERAGDPARVADLDEHPAVLAVDLPVAAADAVQPAGAVVGGAGQALAPAQDLGRHKKVCVRESVRDERKRVRGHRAWAGMRARARVRRDRRRLKGASKGAVP